MANIKWSAFPSVGAQQPTDELVGLRAGSNVRITPPTLTFTADSVLYSNAFGVISSNAALTFDDVTTIGNFVNIMFDAS